MEEIVLKIIIHAGNAKSMLYEALDYAKENDFKKADELIENANEEILKAHKVQT
ncbi:PTS lactose/cellobiose transporter subunit IIA, partial [Clostridioides difficile]